jgi:sulfide dehydrogenase cytochrome subunit
MCTIAAALSDADITAIADYLAQKPFVRAKQSADAAQVERGKKIHDVHCTKCHTDGGSSADDDAGILAGQWIPYIRHTFEEYASGERPLPKKMKPKFDPLSKEDREALVNYYGSFK